MFLCSCSYRSHTNEQDNYTSHPQAEGAVYVETSFVNANFLALVVAASLGALVKFAPQMVQFARAVAPALLVTSAAAPLFPVALIPYIPPRPSYRRILEPRSMGNSDAMEGLRSDARDDHGSTCSGAKGVEVIWQF